MEAIVLGLLSGLAAQGTPWSIAVLACVAAYYFYLQSGKTRTKCDQDIATLREETNVAAVAAAKLTIELYEKRIAESRETLRVLAEGAASNEKLANSVKERGLILDGLRDSIMQLVNDHKQGREIWLHRWQTLQQQLGISSPRAPSP